jgi:putative inorganic carbon (hco3(-)) transporter
MMYRRGVESITLQENSTPLRAAWRLLELEPLWILLLGVPLTFPGRWLPMAWHPYLLLSLFLFWPLHWIKYLRSKPHAAAIPHSARHPLTSPLTIPVLLLLLWLPVTLWAATDRPTAWAAAGYLLFGLALFLALTNWAPLRTHPEWLAWSLLAIGVGLALVSPPIVEWKPQFRLFYLPLYDQLTSIPLDLGDTIHANVLAAALVIVFPLFLSLIIWQMRTGYRWLALVSAALAFVVFFMVILTQSRGGYLALGCSLAIVTLLHWPALWYTAPVLVVAGIVAVNQIGLTTLLNAFSADSAIGGWSERIHIWTQAYHALTDFALTGIGIGNFTTVIPLLYPLRAQITDFPHAHNLLLQIGVDLGLPGLIVYLAIQMLLFIMALSVLRDHARNSLIWALASGVFTGLAALQIHGLLDAATWGLKLAFVPWLLYALITLLFLHAQQTRPIARKANIVLQ